ncbi:MAG: trypsin-like peptidase domain-containing protein [Oscillospiraceae bacterium]|nr:trypsin-like peptidase domain-containing protein [Oscillospiraceae bacterium]
MNFKSEYMRILKSLHIIIFICLILSSCSDGDINNIDRSLVMIKNAGMSTYGAGFAVGIPGKAVNTVVTSYSIVAQSNGAVPKTAEIRIKDSNKSISANVSFYDTARNIAILKLPEETKELKPVVLKDIVDYEEPIYVKGYEGTGNITSDYEKFNSTNIIKYGGSISGSTELNNCVIYRYSNEFNRGSVGAPAVDDHGNCIGMCAYSLNYMNTYSQYILSSGELIRCLSGENIDFVTSDEIKYKNIILLTVFVGFIFLSAIIAFTLFTNKKENNLIYEDRYIRITNGTLKDKVYKLEGKLSIGRDPNRCDIVYPIDEPGVSALHCSVQIHGKDCYLTDNFSKYGTYLEDGTKITPLAPYKIENKNFAFYIAKLENRFEFIDEKEKRK